MLNNLSIERDIEQECVGQPEIRTVSKTAHLTQNIFNFSLLLVRAYKILIVSSYSSTILKLV